MNGTEREMSLSKKTGSTNSRQQSTHQPTERSATRPSANIALGMPDAPATSLSPTHILHLQTTIGNRAVRRLLGRRAAQTMDFGPRDANGVAEGAESAVARAASSSGEPLPVHVRERFERSLGADLSRVRLHTGPESGQAAAAVGAKAYTIGQDIHFGTAQYAPSDAAGLHLLAHEVAHTVQHSGAPRMRMSELDVSAPTDAAEIEAERAADAMVSNAAFGVAGADSALHRDKPDTQAKPPDAPPAAITTPPGTAPTGTPSTPP